MKNASAAAFPVHDYSLTERTTVNEAIISANQRIKVTFTDEEVLKGIKTRDKGIITYIYNTYFSKTREMILAHSGTAPDAEKVFQDAMIIIYKQVLSGELVMSCSFGTYLYSICESLWLRQLQRRGQVPEHSGLVETDIQANHHSPELYTEESEKVLLFWNHFDKMKEEDQKVMKMFLEKVPIARIAAEMGYKSLDYAKGRKVILKEKLKNAILNDPQYCEICQNWQTQ
jgi:DNA-directed RNA polymerase specialized sigma24 family protein